MEEEVEKKEETTTVETPVGETPEELPTEEQEPKETKPEEPCDPLTMSCNAMRDKILDLAGKRAIIDEETRRLEDLKKLDEESKVLKPGFLDEPCKDCEQRKTDIDGEIRTLFDRFTVCAARPVEEKGEEKPPEEEPKEETGIFTEGARV